MINILTIVLLSILGVVIALYCKRSCPKGESPDDKSTIVKQKDLVKEFGVRDGEYVQCCFCGHKMRVGNGRIRLEINCESCGKQIKLRSESEDEYQKTVQQLRREIHEGN